MTTDSSNNTACQSDTSQPLNAEVFQSATCLQAFHYYCGCVCVSIQYVLTFCVYDEVQNNPKQWKLGVILADKTPLKKSTFKSLKWKLVQHVSV